MESATKAPQSVRPADKVLQALATLAALIDATIREVKSLDSEFQTRLLQAVHDTEASLQAQTAQHVERARQEVQEELNVRLQKELQTAVDGLKSDFETERGRFNSEKSGLIAEVEQAKADFAAEIEKAREDLKNAVHKTEVLLQAETAENVERARQSVQDELRSKYQMDLQAAMDGLKAEFEIERGRLTLELQHAAEIASKLESENSTLKAEGQQAKAGAAAEIEKLHESMKKAVQDTETSHEARAALQTTMDGLKAEFEIERGRLTLELQHAAEAASKLESENSKLDAEVQQAKAGAATEIEKLRESMKKAVQDTETSHEAKAAENIERARQEVQDALNVKYRKDLQTATDGLKSEFETERERLNKELLHTVEVASKLESERSGLIAEVQQVKTDSAAAIEKARQEARAAAPKSAPPAAASAPPASVKQEIERAETKLQEILKLIDNPATELSKVIRMNVEKSELEAYLKGIRLVLDTKS